MAATVLDSLVGSCAKKLQDIITDEAILILGVKGDIKELQRTMKQLRCFLNDAEERRTEESAVRNWLGDLKDALYEADDIIDLVRLEGSKLLGHPASSSTRSTACTDFSFLSCLPNIPRRHKIAHRIRNFNTELEKISMLGERFLRLKNVQPKEEIPVAWNMKSCELVEPNLVGKEISLACSRLVEEILAHKKNKTYKVGVVGTGGIGKTSLAQKIYNHHKIKGNFSKQVWICVSQVYSKVSLLKELLRNLEIDYVQDEDVGELSRKLAKGLENNSFFLVLDDVWEHEVWSNLLRIPTDTASTSVVLVTTRNDVVARKIGVDEVHRVDLMSEDVGWELLCKSMDNHEENQMGNLRDIGMDIVRMCGGLPLAIKVIARVLAAKGKTEKQWRNVKNESAWSMTNLPAEIRGALYLSYDDLPRYLKQCFLYCALYPEDWVFHRDHFIRCWIAEGFVQEQGEELLEDTAEKYFYELIYRNLLQPDPSFLDYSRCKMHDLLRQLAQHLTQDECFCGEPESLVAKPLSKLRRVSIVTDKDYIMLPYVENDHIQARTLFVRGIKSLRIGSEAFRRLPCLRVLDLTGSIIQSIPDCVGQLVHLRLLDLNGTDISYLPESIGSLIYLQILNLQRCDALHSLPLAITKLCNLRRLGLKHTEINQVPKGIGKLKFLNDLEGFPVGGGTSNSAKMQDGWNLEELDPLLQLRRLDIKGLERALPCGVSSLLVGKSYLNLLSLSCTEPTDEPYSEEDVILIENLFEELTPPKNLEDLAICQYFGRRYPSWLGSVTNLHSLEYLRLKCSKSCVHLPPIGQLPNLKYLKIKGATAVTKITSELFGCGVHGMGSADLVAFPKLELWLILDMPNLEEFTFSCEEEANEEGGEGATTNQKMNAPSPRMLMLPCLKELDLQNCPKLRSLPWQLGQYATSLRDLYLSDVNNLKVVENLLFLSDSLYIVRCERLERVSNLPKVRELYAEGCPNLRCVDKLDNLQQIWLDEDTEEVSSLWLPGLQERCQELHDEELEFYNWT